MSKKPLALHLADVLDKGENFYFESSLHWDRNLAEAVGSAANELRRLHGVNAELLAALTHAVEIAENKRPGTWDDLLQYRAAIAKATGGEA